MNLLIPSFLAGLLTILAPCVLALLPVIIGGSAGEKNPWRPLIITTALGISVIAFTLLLKISTLLIDIPNSFWKYFSGTLIILFAIITIFPTLWEQLAFKLKLYKSEELIEKSAEKGGNKGAILLGASLGPVFTSCSPTYALIIAIVLPQNFATGLLNLIVYTIGMIIPLLLIGYGGQKISSKFRSAANPNGLFKKSLGILLLITGLAIFTGYDKVIESKIIEAGYLGPIELEQSILDSFEKSEN